MNNDITHCEGGKCNMKELCGRYVNTTIVKEYGSNTSYFRKPPFTVKHGLFRCQWFWGDAATMLLEQLKEIMKVPNMVTTKRKKS